VRGTHATRPGIGRSPGYPARRQHDLAAARRVGRARGQRIRDDGAGGRAGTGVRDDDGIGERVARRKDALPSEVLLILKTGTWA